MNEELLDEGKLVVNRLSAIALIDGGSMVIRHLRRAVARCTELEGRHTGG